MRLTHGAKEAWENEDIYDDLEPSLAGDFDHCDFQEKI